VAGAGPPGGAPGGSRPARALAAGSPPGRVYLAGWWRLHRSDDWGLSWAAIDGGLPGGPVESLAVAPGSPDVLYAVADGGLWASPDAGASWSARWPGGHGDAEAVAAGAGRLWVMASGRLFRGDDGGNRWEAVGRPLPERDARVHAFAVLDPVVLVATDRGVYRSPDGGARWEPPSEGLPGHLEAGPLVVDPRTPGTVYAGFALTPYAQLRRQAADGTSALAQLGPITVAGATAFLALLGLGAAAALRRLARAHYRVPRPAPPRQGAA
jgi:hypothetical protein